ncbi:MAG: Dps family protein, partial [Enterovibrio sp.]
APGTYREFMQLASIKETATIPSADEMIQILVKNHEQIVKTARKALKFAQNGNDESSIALVSDRMRVHEKTAWMLRSLLA